MAIQLPQPTKLIIGMARPAGMGSACDCWSQNPKPGPRLIRCRRRARYRLTIKTPTDCYTLKRCQAHRDELQAKVANGATFEILDEQAIQDARTKHLNGRS